MASRGFCGPERFRPRVGSSAASSGFSPDEWLWREPLGLWLDLASQAAAVISLSSRLRVGHKGGEKEWLALSVPPPSTLRLARTRLALVVNAWLREGQVQPWVSWTDGDLPELAFGAGFSVLGGGGDLYGLIAWHLATALGRPDALLVPCSGCTKYYSPRRMPSAGQLNFCPDCRDDGTEGRIRVRLYRSGRRVRQR